MRSRDCSADPPWSTLLEQPLDAFKAVAEPSRLRLLALCARGELTVTELTEVVGQSQPRVSRHLKVLCAAGLLDRFREHSWVYYRVPLTGTGAKLDQFRRQKARMGFHNPVDLDTFL